MRQELGKASSNALPASRTRISATESRAPRADSANRALPRPKPAAKTVSRSSADRDRRGSGFGRGGAGANRDAGVEDLERRLGEREKLLGDSQAEVLALRAQVEKLQVLNAELELENKNLADGLTVAEAKIKSLEHKCDQANSIIISGVARPPPSPLPPPPPPPPAAGVQFGLGKAKTVHKASALVELYNSLTKRDGKQGSMSTDIVRISIVGELQNRSAYLLAIKSDVETKGHLINHLIEKVQSASFTNMEEALSFVDWLDGELSTLADESAVLKHFDWPEKKADALREAAYEFRALKSLKDEASCFKDDDSLACETTLKRISSFLVKLEQNTSRLINLRATSMLLYRECKIPTDWMLDSGMVSKMKQVSVMLAKVYMRKVSLELESTRHAERESAQEALLFEGVRFAYRAHQFAGGLDSETMLIFEKLKTRVESQGRGH